jgi:hypothetical protein
MHNVIVGGVPVKKKTQYQEYHKNTTDERNHTLQSLCVRHEFDSLEFQYELI